MPRPEIGRRKTEPMPVGNLQTLGFVLERLLVRLAGDDPEKWAVLERYGVIKKAAQS